jgi:hypothetical protein
MGHEFFLMLLVGAGLFVIARIVRILPGRVVAPVARPTSGDRPLGPNQLGRLDRRNDRPLI